MIWVVGASGMLGTELVTLMRREEVPFRASDLDVSILNPRALKRFAWQHSPDWIVNCAAYTAVDKAEDEPDLAFQINTEGVENLARLGQELSIPVLHISTDYVFDGSSDTPLPEDAPTAPLGVYGQSKLAGEERLRVHQPKHVIIRTAWLYGAHGRNFVYTMLRLMDERDQVPVVSDQVGSPTWTRNLAQAILAVITHPQPQFGTFHYSGDGQTSWHGFATRIYQRGRELGLIESPCSVVPISSDQYPTRARRPAFSLLDKDRIQRTFGVDVPSWQDALDRFLKETTREDFQ